MPPSMHAFGRKVGMTLNPPARVNSPSFPYIIACACQVLAARKNSCSHFLWLHFMTYDLCPLCHRCVLLLNFSLSWIVLKKAPTTLIMFPHETKSTQSNRQRHSAVSGHNDVASPWHPNYHSKQVFSSFIHQFIALAVASVISSLNMIEIRVHTRY